MLLSNKVAYYINSNPQQWLGLLISLHTQDMKYVKNALDLYDLNNALGPWPTHLYWIYNITFQCWFCLCLKFLEVYVHHLMLSYFNSKMSRVIYVHPIMSHEKLSQGLYTSVQKKCLKILLQKLM